MRPLGLYVHVPFCAVRCGYCDFNTYAPGEAEGASPASFVEAALAEMDMAAAHPHFTGREVSTVFFGGGTPTLLPVDALVALLEQVQERWGLADDAEVTTEANPDSVSAEGLQALARAGFTRVSVGMQSAVPHVLRTLDRTHQPANVERAVAWAKDAGLQVSLDLIYGTPGESLADWQRSLDAVVALEPDHVSAYALVIEPGTKMGAQLRRGEIEATDPDQQAAMYEAADRTLTNAGLSWYEVSNWARTPDNHCRHNLGYWRGHDWWGIGPGAHSYDVQAGRRWWNLKHPRAYADTIAGGKVPEAGAEVLGEAERQLERVMLGIRVADGLPLSELRGAAQAQADRLVEQGLVMRTDDHLVLTLRGRLLADAVVRDLT